MSSLKTLQIVFNTFKRKGSKVLSSLSSQLRVYLLMIPQISRNEAETVKGHISPIIQANILFYLLFQGVPMEIKRRDPSWGKTSRMLPEDTSKEVRGQHQDYISTAPSQEEAKDISSGVRLAAPGLYNRNQDILLLPHRGIFPSQGDIIQRKERSRVLTQ